ncbi:MAG: NACHT domain-containing protein, partial [Planctomyces sp.]
MGSGLFATISGQPFTAGLTASVALKFKDPDRTLSPTDLTVLIEEIHCEPVLGAEYKLGAAAAAGLRGTALHEHNRIDAEKYLNQTPENRCRPTYVDDFQQLYRYLTRGFHIDSLVALESQTMQEHWTQARNGQTLDNQRHHLDVFVKPRLSLRVSRTKHQAGRITEKWRKLPAGVGRLLNQHLLPSDQWLIIHEDAGGGKTVLSWLLAAALSRLAQKFWVVHYEGQEFPRDLRLDLETRLQGKLQDYGITQSAAKVLEDLLEQRRVVVIYDALDQGDSKDSVNRIQRMRKDQQLAGLRLIVTSRPYAVNQNYAAEFHREYWLHCRLELFDQRQQASYQRQVARLAESRAAGAAALVRTAYQQLLPEPEQVADLLRYPVVQKQLRTIIEEHLAANSSGPLRPFKNAGDLYWEVADRLLDRAFKSRRYQDQLHHRVNLIKLLACYGYLMMLRFRTYKVRTQAIPQIRSEVKQRFAGTADDWQICSDILVDTSLTEHLLLKENAERVLSFPSLKMAEFFAALYLGRYCDERVISELQPEIGNGKWDNVWKFVAELPETTNRQGDPVAVPASLSCSLQALFAVPDEGRERPTESMFRAWQVLQRNTWLQQV